MGWPFFSWRRLGGDGAVHNPSSWRCDDDNDLVGVIVMDLNGVAFVYLDG